MRRPCGSLAVVTTPDGLYKQDVGELLLRERPAVEAHLVGALHEGVQLPDLAVDGDAAGLDQLVRLAS